MEEHTLIQENPAGVTCQIAETFPLAYYLYGPPPYPGTRWAVKTTEMQSDAKSKKMNTNSCKSMQN